MTITDNTQLSVSDYYSEDGKPIKCWKCNSINIKDFIVDIIDNQIVLEFECVCTDCNERVGYNFHGYYDPCFMLNERFIKTNIKEN